MKITKRNLRKYLCEIRQDLWRCYNCKLYNNKTKKWKYVIQNNTSNDGDCFSYGYSEAYVMQTKLCVDLDELVDFSMFEKEDREYIISSIMENMLIR